MAEPSTSNVAKRGKSSSSKTIESESKKRRPSSPLKFVDTAGYKKLSVFKKPCPLVAIDGEGKLKPCVNVLSQLKQIECPLNVIAITGPYRTGKSYLLKRLAGKRKGFPLGSTVYSETKGIWVWCQQHPVKQDEVLLMLDTEGLGNIIEDEETDAWIFTLSVLLSSTLVYNCNSSIINQDGLSHLHIVTEMTNRIKKRETSEDEDGSEFFTFFPNFVWVVRDFTLELKDKEGNPITSDQFLLHALQPRKGNTRNIVAYNTSRQCLWEYFADKKCFCFPRPVEDGSRLKELESLPDAQLDVMFVEEVKKFCDYIYSQSFHKTAEGQPVQGEMFCHLLETYLESIQSGNIPCVENAVNKMAEKKNADAVEASLKVYEKEMKKILQKSIKTLREIFKAHQDCYSKAMDTFMSMSVLDEKGKYQYQLKEIIGQKFNEIEQEWVQDQTERDSASGDHDLENERALSALREVQIYFSSLQQNSLREEENRRNEADRRLRQRQNELEEIRDNLPSQQENNDAILNTLSEQTNKLERDRENAENNLRDIRQGGSSFGTYLQRAGRVCALMAIAAWPSYQLGVLLFPQAALAVAAVGAILHIFKTNLSTQDSERRVAAVEEQQKHDEQEARVSLVGKCLAETKVKIKGLKEREEKTKEEMWVKKKRLTAVENETRASFQTDVASSGCKKEIQEMFIDTFSKEKLEIFLSVNRTDPVLTYLLRVTLAEKSKEALCVIMAYINKKFKEDLNDNNIAVWLGSDHKGNKTGESVLVCFHSAYTVTKFSQLAELRVIYRRFDEIEMEPMENRLQEKRESVPFTEHDVAAIKHLISEHGKYLFTIHSNLEAISASPIRSTKQGIINETSIVLYCRLKGVIPYGEDFFPKVLKVDQQRYPTDIREGFFSLGMTRAQRQQNIPHPHSKNEPLRMGCSIGASGFRFAGTLGPFVRIDNDIGFLTCAHVLEINSSSTKRNVVQPSDIEVGLSNVTRLCGTFIREKFDTSTAIGVDAALVCIDKTKRDVALGCFVWSDSNQPRKIGMFEDDLPSFVGGEVIVNPDFQKLWERRDVCKFGRSTGLTQGLLLLENAMLKVHDAHLSLPSDMSLPHGYPSNTFIMNGQFLIQNVGTEPFFAPGDSGAGVYVVRRNGQGESRLALIGIAIGSLTSGECVMTPIGRVLEALQLEETDIITEGSMDIDP